MVKLSNGLDETSAVHDVIVYGEGARFKHNDKCFHINTWDGAPEPIELKTFENLECLKKPPYKYQRLHHSRPLQEVRAHLRAYSHML